MIGGWSNENFSTDSEKEPKMYIRYGRRYKILGLTLNEWFILILISIPTSWLVANYFYIPTVISEVTSIPEEIIRDGLENNAVAVYLFGTYEEKHRFAKGQRTRFGSMPYPVDERLWSSRDMDEEEIHDIGSRLGFCKPEKNMKDI